MLDKELLRCIFLLKDLDVRKSICCEEMHDGVRKSNEGEIDDKVGC